MKGPHFSVIIPTYNRAHLLPLAVQSVLAQSFEDFEIVISDGASTDNTQEVVKAIGDDRIRYFSTSEKVPVGENYQNGLNQATGEYITFLSDDDAYTPELLGRVKEVIEREKAEIVGYPYCRYYHDDLYDFERNIPKNSLLISKFDGRVTKFSSAEALDQVFALHGLRGGPVDPRFICPYLSNATYHRSIFDRLRKVRENLFDMVPPDIYLAAAVFYMVESYHCLDEPLLVWSNWEGNATASAQRTENKIRDHYERLLNGKELAHTPLKFALAMNCGANAILEAASGLGNGLADVDWVTYFVRTYENFIYLKSVGVNTEREEAEFVVVIKCQPEEIRSKVQKEISGMLFSAKAFLNSRMPGVAAKMRKVLNRRALDEMKVVEGRKAGFSNVADASRCVLNA